MNLLNDSQASSSSSSLHDDDLEPTLPLLRNHTTTPRHPQQQRLEPQSPPQPTDNLGPRRGTVHTPVVSFNDHVEIQHYDPAPAYNDDDDSGDDDMYHQFYDATDRMLIHDDSETDDDSSSTSHSHHHHLDMYGLPMVDTSLTPLSVLHRSGVVGEDGLLQQSPPPAPLHMSTGSRRSRPLHHHHLPMHENLQGYTDLTDFATLTDSSNSDADSSHGSLSHGLLVPPASHPQHSPQHLPLRHSNLAQQLLSSSASNVPPCIIVDEYDVSSSSSGSVVSDLQHSRHHYIDPNLYPLQQQRRIGNDEYDDVVNPEYYFEVQSLDSCFLPGTHPPPLYNDDDVDVDDDTNRRHPHYRLSILKQRLRESVLAGPFSPSRFRRNSNNSNSRDDTEAEVSDSNNHHYNDILVHAEPILLPYVNRLSVRSLLLNHRII